MSCGSTLQQLHDWGIWLVLRFQTKGYWGQGSKTYESSLLHLLQTFLFACLIVLLIPCSASLFSWNFAESNSGGRVSHPWMWWFGSCDGALENSLHVSFVSWSWGLSGDLNKIADITQFFTPFNFIGSPLCILGVFIFIRTGWPDWSVRKLERINFPKP